MSLFTIWETCMCNLKGGLISLGNRLKKLRNSLIQNLIQKIAQIEQVHACSPSRTYQSYLTTQYMGLLDFLKATFPCNIFLQIKLFYEHGNKSSKYLVNALWDHNSENNIFKIRDPHNKPHHNSADIAHIFSRYYLYNLPTSLYTSSGIEDRSKANYTLSNFLSFNHGLKKIDLIDSSINTFSVKGGIILAAILYSDSCDHMKNLTPNRST